MQPNTRWENIMSALAISELNICNKQIRTLNGLYSLNDLHRASGEKVKHKPAFFLRNNQTQEVIGELQKCYSSEKTLFVKRGGKNQGTWVCKELVYSYAMWISAKFHLIVIRAFDALVTGKIKPQINTEKLYEICAGTVEVGMEYLTLVHNISLTLSNDSEYQLKSIASKVMSAINFSKENNLTNKRSEPMFDCGELNFSHGGKIIYTPKKMQMLAYYAN